MAQRTTSCVKMFEHKNIPGSPNHSDMYLCDHVLNSQTAKVY